MSDISLQDDIDLINEVAADWRQSHSKKNSGYGPRALILSSLCAVDLLDVESDHSYWQYDPFYADMLAREARGHWDVHRMYRNVIASKIKAGVELFEEEKIFAAEMLTDPDNRPKMPGRNKIEDNFTRNLLILAFLEVLVEEHNLSPFRSDAKKDPAFDAPSIISEAFKKAGDHSVSYNMIKGVLQNKELEVWRGRLLKLKEKMPRAQALRFVAELNASSQQ